MKVDASQIRMGSIILHKGKKCVVLKRDTVKPGKGPAYAQLELRDIESGSKMNDRFNTSDKVEKLETSDLKCQFLYADADGLNFMNTETYDQFTLPADIMGEQLPFLTDGMEVNLKLVDGEPFSVGLPQSVICTVADTEAVVKGQTAASSNKPATLDNGLRIMVPPFITVGEEVVVNTQDIAYMERAKK